MLETQLDDTGNAPLPAMSLRKRKGTATKHKRMTRPKFTGGNGIFGNIRGVPYKRNISSPSMFGFGVVSSAGPIACVTPRLLCARDCMRAHFRDADGVLKPTTN